MGLALLQRGDVLDVEAFDCAVRSFGAVPACVLDGVLGSLRIEGLAVTPGRGVDLGFLRLALLVLTLACTGGAGRCRALSLWLEMRWLGTVCRALAGRLMAPAPGCAAAGVSRALVVSTTARRGIRNLDATHSLAMHCDRDRQGCRCVAEVADAPATVGVDHGADTADTRPGLFPPGPRLADADTGLDADRDVGRELGRDAGRGARRRRLPSASQRACRDTVRRSCVKPGPSTETTKTRIGSTRALGVSFGGSAPGLDDTRHQAALPACAPGTRHGEPPGGRARTARGPGPGPGPARASTSAREWQPRCGG